MNRRKFVYSGLGLTLSGTPAEAAEANGATDRAQGAHSGTRPVKGLIAMRNDEHPVPLAHAVNRLRAYSPIALDMSCSPDPRVHPELYAFTLLVGVTGKDPELRKAWGDNQPASEDAWALRTLAKSPLTIAVTGKRPRGVLYAAYRLADYMKLGRDLANLNEVHEPRIAQRECYLGAGAMGDRIEPRYSQYMATVNELPRYGLNGVKMVPGNRSLPPLGTDHENLPVSVDKNGKLFVDEARRLKWMSVLDAIKSYDMDITVTSDPIVPPGYAASQVQEFVRTGNVPREYLESLRSFYGDYINKLFDVLPQIDAIAQGPGVEGAMYSQNASLHGVRLFLDGQNIEACTTIMSVYFDVLTRIAKVRGKRVLFRIHSYGTTSDGMRAMWELPARYEGVVRLADDRWPNELWPIETARMPIYNYLPPDTRAKFDEGAPLGALVILDGECDGDGWMPNALADQYPISSEELIKHRCAWIALRLNYWDWTPWGTLWNVTGIQIEQYANAIWTNARTPQRVWDEWIERQWGKRAAPFVSAALAKSGTIILDGFFIDGNCMFHHSTIGPKRWTPSKEYAYESSSFHMFRRPGTLLYAKDPAAPVKSEEQIGAQLHSKAMAIEEFRKRQARAKRAVEEALSELDKASPYLCSADDSYLHTIFHNARLAIRVFSAMGEMAYAANLLRDNYAGVADPGALFDKAAADVEKLAADPALAGEFSYSFAYRPGRNSGTANDGMKRVLVQVAAMYRDYARSLKPAAGR